jgi:hypothetical protein
MAHICCSDAPIADCNFGTHSVLTIRTLFAYRPAVEVDAMRSGDLSAEAVAAILFGLLQLAVGIISLWQQRQLRQAYRTYQLAVNRTILMQ